MAIDAQQPVAEHEPQPFGDLPAQVGVGPAVRLRLALADQPDEHAPSRGSSPRRRRSRPAR